MESRAASLRTACACFPLTVSYESERQRATLRSLGHSSIPFRLLLTTNPFHILAVPRYRSVHRRCAPTDRMAPEDPHPAAVVDALAAYKYVLSLGVPPSKIVLAGDSAGGGLTYATAIYLRDNPTFAPQVAGLAPISPWIDLTASSPTDILRDEFDSCIISAGQSSTEGMRFAYAGGKDKHPHKAKEPTFSPLFDFKKEKLPPAITSLATVDRLLGMDLAYYIRKLGEGETVQVDIYEDQFHGTFER